jgi:hypothetical protein
MACVWARVFRQKAKVDNEKRMRERDECIHQSLLSAISKILMQETYPRIPYIGVNLQFRS